MKITATTSSFPASHTVSLFTHHKQALVSVDNSQPNGHMCVLTVFQEGPDGYVLPLGVCLQGNKEKRDGLVSGGHMHVKNNNQYLNTLSSK